MSTWFLIEQGRPIPRVVHAPDITVSESHSVSAAISNAPVQARNNASNHYEKNPDVLTLEEVVGEGSPGNRDEAGRPATPSRGRVSDAWKDIEEAFDNALIMTIVTSLKIYPAVMITSVDGLRNMELQRGMRYTASFQQVRFFDAFLSETLGASADQLLGPAVDQGSQVPG